MYLRYIFPTQTMFYVYTFLLGWKQEIVYRNKIDGDVYYFTAQDRNLRSLNEIQEYLNSMACDTLDARIIHLYDFRRNVIFKQL